jgi:hypothetical protein
MCSEYDPRGLNIRIGLSAPKLKLVIDMQQQGLKPGQVEHLKDDLLG